LSKEIHNFLSSVSLEQLLESAAVRAVAARQKGEQVVKFVPRSRAAS
jgi:hypothetical protein